MKTLLIFVFFFAQTNEASVSSINYPLGFKTDPDALPSNSVQIPPKLNNNNIGTNATDTKPLLLGVA